MRNSALLKTVQFAVLTTLAISSYSLRGQSNASKNRNSQTWVAS